MNKDSSAITRRLDNALNDIQEEFKGIYLKKDFTRAIDALISAGNKSDRASKLKTLFRMLDACNIPYEKGKENDYYINLIRTTELPSYEDIEDKMMLSMYFRFDSFPTPEEYMKRLVDRLCNPEDCWENDTLRLRILKQFIKYGDYLKNAVTGTINEKGEVRYKGPGGERYIMNYVKEKSGKDNNKEEILQNIDDGVFDILTTANKAQKKLYSKYGIIKVADDLANGKFRVWGVTKRNLYLFAMVYEMTFFTGREDDMSDKDKQTDISVNLFRDYYSNNFIRFITDSYKGKLQEYELDPSGQGINYKNYAEMIYLYYISQNMTPTDKLLKSHEMIDRIRREMRGRQQSGIKEKNYDTDRFRSYFKLDSDKPLYAEDVLSLPEKEFEVFLRNTYTCDVMTSTGDVNPMQLETDQNSAFEEYDSIVKSIRKRGLTPNDCDYGLMFTDIDAFIDKSLRKKIIEKNEMDEKRFADYANLLRGVHNYLIKSTNLKKESHDDITRSAIIAVYYYYYNDIHLNDEGYGCKGFGEFFSDFQKSINMHLEKSHYQPFSGRNIYDVLVAFSSYAYIYL